MVLVLGILSMGVITSAESMVLMTKRSLPSDSFSFFPHMCVQLGAKAQTTGLRQVFCCPPLTGSISTIEELDQVGFLKHFDDFLAAVDDFFNFTVHDLQLVVVLQQLLDQTGHRFGSLQTLQKNLEKTSRQRLLFSTSTSKTESKRGSMDYSISYWEWPYHGIMDWLKW